VPDRDDGVATLEFGHLTARRVDHRLRGRAVKGARERQQDDHRPTTVKTFRSFAVALAETRLPSVFNPYGDHCPVHDRPDAARVRKRNLVSCLEAALAAHVDTIWIAIGRCC
jgi:hypothetical protein